MHHMWRMHNTFHLAGSLAVLSLLDAGSGSFVFHYILYKLENKTCNDLWG